MFNQSIIKQFKVIYLIDFSKDRRTDFVINS